MRMSSQSRVTLAEIAAQSGVSLSTVSLVLRDKSGVGSDTRQRVLDVAKTLGYINHNSATQYKSSLTNIGLILKAEPGRLPQANLFYSRVLTGIETVCRQQQYNLLYATVLVDQDSHPIELPRILVEEDTVDGLLLVGAFLDDTLGRVFERKAVPIILVDAYAASGEYDAVVSDNVQGACAAATYLIQQGHHHIGFVASHPHAYPSIQERRQGYARTLEDSGIADQYYANCHIVDQQEILDATTDLLRRNPQITAVLGANDQVAITVIEAAQALGRRVPDDLSVMGFDNIELADRISPALTTMHIDKAGMGRMAVQLLVNRAAYPNASPVTTFIRPRLIERQSVRKI
jgi:LacI family transcriptional regulator